jgi:hypothetical protein
MHGLYLTAMSILLIVALLVYVVLAEGAGEGTRKVRLIFSWLVSALALLLLVGVNVVCPFERPAVRILYIVLFLLILYNSFADQFMDESLLTMSVPTKAKIVGIVVIAFIAYLVARTRVWMNCNMHLDAIQNVYHAALTPHSLQAGGVEVTPVFEVMAAERLPSREHKVSLMESIINSMAFKPREVDRMLTQKRRQSRASARSRRTGQ